ncbi:DUF2509 family protein [Pantoea sp. GD03673]|uniref:DUF2509 family protein n=1 Tax=Pantoea sp. GD03673 TaxID=2975364 RepID=UPI00244ACA4D|nr:DUF2509 family protein [Pantoea sp. GD03673]MDH2068148.1 YgdB family protein [Pantoea sp. GD03673]
MKQRGSSALGMVLMIMVIGSFTLHASRKMSEQGMRLLADEQQYVQDFWRAQSALQWGLSMSWSAAKPALCQQDDRQGWRSCLQRGENNEGLLKGEASGRGMAVWHWVRLRGNQITALPHGWIDYCPLTSPATCQ